MSASDNLSKLTGNHLPFDEERYAEELHFPVVILGGGVAGGNCATHLAESLKRESSYNKMVQEHVKTKSGSFCALIGTELTPPYERPALTKILLYPPSMEAFSSVRGDFNNFLIPYTQITYENKPLEIQTEKWYEDNNIALFLGHEAVSIDSTQQFMVIKPVGKERLVKVSFDRMIFATGSRPLFTSIFNEADILDNVFVMRQFSDVEKVRKAMQGLSNNMRRWSLLPNSAKEISVCVVGGGYIGIETALALSRYPNTKVTMIFLEESVLENKLPIEISKWLTKWIESRGIRVIRSAQIRTFLGKKDTLTHAVLSNDQKVKADIAVVGIGVLLNTELLADQVDLVQVSKGLNQAISVDRFMKTTDPTIFAAGDTAAYPFQRKAVSFEHADFARASAQTAMENVLRDLWNSGPYNKGKIKELQPVEYDLPFYELTLPADNAGSSFLTVYAFGMDGIQTDLLKPVFFGDFTQNDLTEKGVVYTDKLGRLHAGIILCGTAERQMMLSTLITKHSHMSAWKFKKAKFFKNQII